MASETLTEAALEPPTEPESAQFNPLLQPLTESEGAQFNSSAYGDKMIDAVIARLGDDLSDTLIRKLKKGLDPSTYTPSGYTPSATLKRPGFEPSFQACVPARKSYFSAGWRCGRQPPC